MAIDLSCQSLITSPYPYIIEIIRTHINILIIYQETGTMKPNLIIQILAFIVALAGFSIGVFFNLRSSFEEDLEREKVEITNLYNQKLDAKNADIKTLRKVYQKLEDKNKVLHESLFNAKLEIRDKQFLGQKEYMELSLELADARTASTILKNNNERISRDLVEMEGKLKASQRLVKKQAKQLRNLEKAKNSVAFGMQWFRMGQKKEREAMEAKSKSERIKLHKEAITFYSKAATYGVESAREDEGRVRKLIK